jgi:hypothetical protein
VDIFDDSDSDDEPLVAQEVTRRLPGRPALPMVHFGRHKNGPCTGFRRGDTEFLRCGIHSGSLVVFLLNYTGFSQYVAKTPIPPRSKIFSVIVSFFSKTKKIKSSPEKLVESVTSEDENTF